MLGLAEQIGRANFAVHALVSDDQCLGRSSKQINADTAEQLALGFGDISIPRSNDHIDGTNGLSAKGHRCDRLHAAEHENLVGAAKMHRRDNRRVRAALKWRRASNDVFHAGNARGDDRHMRRSNHRIAPAGHIATDY